MTRRRKILTGAAAVAAALFGYWFYLIMGLPSLDALKDYSPNLVSKVYSNDGQLVAEFFMERRIVVPMERIPKHLVKAFVAAEDNKFFEHEGISYTSILRAFYKNLTAGKVVQGGSTITQQLAKTFFLSPERKISRKLREMILAYRIEKNLTKDEIMHLYLNQIYFGNGAYGVQAAAESYFGKDVQNLTLAESAMLAGLPKAPSRYSPYVNFDLAKKRQEYVLGRMIEDGQIKPVQMEKALTERLRLKAKENTDSLWVGPYYTEHIRRYLEEKYGDAALYRGGLRVYTTMDVEMQRAANAAVRDGLREYDKRRGYRGPVERLNTVEDVEAFRADAAAKYPDTDSLEPGEIYRVMVSSFDPRGNRLNVELGPFKGVISREDMAWAALYNPTADPNGGRQEKLDRLFKPGDVVEAVVKAVPYAKGMPYPMRLEQPPLAQASLVAMDPATGSVKAMVGGSDFNKTQFNRAVQAMRQPGSAFKPIIYTAAIDKGYTPASIVMDTPIVFEDTEKEQTWRPRNYDEKFFGPTTVRSALAKSRNVITIKILKDIGVTSAVDYARRFGIIAPLANDLSLALGSSSLTLMELTTAYSTIANGGTRPAPLFILKVVDKDGAVLEENQPVATEVFSQQTAFIMTSLLQGVIENGTGKRALSLGRPAAGKTGTTNALNDAWFIGFVPDLTAGAWVGYDDEKELGKRETGAAAALPIWLKFMKKAVAGTPVRNFKPPDGVEFARIDANTGLLAGPATEKAIFEVFKTGTAPKKVSEARAQDAQSDFFMMESGSKPVYDQAPPDEEEDEPHD